MTEKSAKPDDYVFRYQLETRAKEPLYRDHLVEMVRAQLENILNIVILINGDREVKVDGFKLLNARKTTYKIFPTGH